MSWWGDAAGAPTLGHSEKELVAECKKIAAAMNAYLELAGQLKARGSGSTVGLPDGFLYCARKCLPIEFKTEKGRLSAAQAGAQHRRMEQGVHTWIIRKPEEFIDLVNLCRRTA